MRMGKTESTLHAPRSTHLLPDATPPRKREGPKQRTNSRGTEADTVGRSKTTGARGSGASIKNLGETPSPTGMTVVKP